MFFTSPVAPKFFLQHYRATWVFYETLESNPVSHKSETPRIFCFELSSQIPLRHSPFSINSGTSELNLSRGTSKILSVCFYILSHYKFGISKLFHSGTSESWPWHFSMLFISKLLYILQYYRAIGVTYFRGSSMCVEKSHLFVFQNHRLPLSWYLSVMFSHGFRRHCYGCSNLNMFGNFVIGR